MTDRLKRPTPAPRLAFARWLLLADHACRSTYGGAASCADALRVLRDSTHHWDEWPDRQPNDAWQAGEAPEAYGSGLACVLASLYR